MAPVAQRLRLWLRGMPRLRLALLRLFGERIERARRRREAERSARYAEWAARHASLSDEQARRLAAYIAALPSRPRFAVTLPAGGTHLAEAIAALRAQLWPEWELLVAGPVPPEGFDGPARADARMRWVPAASADAVAAAEAALGATTADWLLPLDADGVLAPHALAELALAMRDAPKAAMIYADEDRIDASGRRTAPWFKGALDPEALLAQDVVGQPAAWRVTALRRIGGPRAALGAAAWQDLALRLVESEGAGAAVHVPAVLLHRRAACAPAGDVAVVQAHLARIGATGAEAEPSPLAPALVRVRWPLPDPAPLVSVIIPTRDRAELLAPCVAGLLGGTDYPALEVLVADNGSERTETFALFDSWRADARVRVLPMPGPFNYARLNNRAVEAAQGEVLLLLNNDTEVIEPGWLHEMASLAVRPDVGAVGARLLYPDGTLQHAGVVLGFGWPRGVAGHVYLGAPGDHLGERDMLGAVRGVSAVTAACLAVRRAAYRAVGGMDEEKLAVAFNDVDLCLKLRAAGLRNLLTPFAVLTHKESASRGRDLDLAKSARLEGEVAVMRARWGALLDADSCWNPNLSLLSGWRDIAAVPRRVPPWEEGAGGAAPLP